MAANPERGEVDMVVGEKTYTLRPTMNAICVMQKRTGQTYGQLLSSCDDMDIFALREVLFTFLQPYHAKEVNSLDKAGDLMDALGGHKASVNVIVEVMTVNSKRSKTPGVGPSDPQMAQVGTGSSSGETPGASA